MTSKRYTKEQIKIIAKMAGEGDSAEMISRQFGVSRNAIVGICARQEIALISNRRAKQIVTLPDSNSTSHRHLQNPAASLRTVGASIAPDAHGLSDTAELPIRTFRGQLEPAERGCRYQLRGGGHCCEPKVGRTSYCAPHYKKMYEGKKVPKAASFANPRIAQPYL